MGVKGASGIDEGPGLGRDDAEPLDMEVHAEGADDV